MTGMLRKNVKFPAAAPRGNPLIHALATQVQQTRIPVQPAATATINLTAQQRVQNFNQVAVQRLQQTPREPGIHASSETQTPAQRVRLALQNRTERLAQLRALLSATAEPSQLAAQASSPATRATDIRQAENSLDDMQSPQ